MSNPCESEPIKTQAVHHSIDRLREATTPQQFTPLELETRPTVSTAAASFYLHYAKQTLRIFASRETGPLRPIRVGAHLHWKTEDIRKLLGVK
jgi:hypothetical protein